MTRGRFSLANQAAAFWIWHCPSEIAGSRVPTRASQIPIRRRRRIPIDVAPCLAFPLMDRLRRLFELTRQRLHAPSLGKKCQNVLGQLRQVNFACHVSSLLSILGGARQNLKLATPPHVERVDSCHFVINTMHQLVKFSTKFQYRRVHRSVESESCRHIRG